ncbi:MAG: nicotinate-nucleotide adenylyltransferase [Deltaproteobacteria bacterium]|jgi:nicotinate-nucleotide adenylyltransferase|nr:nicotinate-nucleotide adenylyltransferase [Deltaproteobacteria bacterium]
MSEGAESAVRRGIGIMGGAFNPPHLGHLRTAEEAMERFGLARVLFMPTALAPHKGSEEMAPFRDRLRMVELAIAGREGFAASDLEARLPKPSYTVNTLRALAREWGESVYLYFLVGFDSFAQIHLWRGFPEHFKLASFVVNARPTAPGSLELLGERLEKILGLSPVLEPIGKSYLIAGMRPVYYFAGTKLSISSTDLRRRLSSGKSARYLVPPNVLEYLLEKGVYA